MIRPSPPPLTLEAARDLQRLLGAEIGPGLSEQELDEVEARFGFRFAADHRVFLSAGLPLGSRSWPDWRHGDPEDLRARLAWPVDGVLFDVERNGFWHPGWGPKPGERSDALRLARAELATVPQLVPIYSYRYLPGAEREWGHPVLSVHQTDVIHYGDDLTDYIWHEFAGRSSGGSRAWATVGFWSYLVEGCPEAAFVTPHDPYAETPEEAVEHLRMLALERLIRRQVEDGQLVQAGLVALVLDVQAPSLPALAGLAPDGLGQAGSLFEQVLTELEIAPARLADDTDLRWELVRWWLRLIVNGSMRPAVGGAVITYSGWLPLSQPEALRPLVDSIAADGVIVVAEAERLLAGPWPPRAG